MKVQWAWVGGTAAAILAESFLGFGGLVVGGSGLGACDCGEAGLEYNVVSIDVTAAGAASADVATVEAAWAGVDYFQQHSAGALLFDGAETFMSLQETEVTGGCR